MKKITSYDFNLSARTIFQDCLKHLESKPFDQFVFICDDLEAMEEMCLQYTSTLFSIECMHFNQFINQLLAYNHIRKTKIEALEARMMIRELLKKEDTLFTTTLATSKDFYHLFQELSLLEDIQDSLNDPKTAQIIELYYKFLASIPKENYFQVLDCFEQIKCPIHTHYVFLSTTIFNPKTMHLLEQIDITNNVTMVIPYHPDNQTSSIYQPYIQNSTCLTSNSDALTKQLFSNDTNKIENNPCFEALCQTTPNHEIQAIVCHIQELVIEKGIQYKDISIYYPNSSYASLLQETLTLFSIPFNQVVRNKDNTMIPSLVMFLKYIHTNKEQDLINFLDTQVVYLPKNNQYKLQWQNIHTIEDEDYINLKENWLTNYITPLKQAKTMQEISSQLILFVEQFYSSTENKKVLIKYLETLKKEYPIQLKEYSTLLQEKTITLHKDTTMQDHIHLFSSNEPYAGLVSSKYIYLVGNNETVLPPLMKDVSLLLNKQRVGIPNLDTTFDQSKKEQNNIIPLFSYFPTKYILSYALSTIDGQTLLKSSLINQLEKIYTLPYLDSNKLLIHPLLAQNYHLTNNIDKELSIYPSIYQFMESNNQPEAIQSIAPETLSPSQLEVYNGCPYKYFYQHVIKLRARENHLIQSNEIGSLVHHLLDVNKNLFSSKQITKTTSLDDLVEKLQEQINDYLLTNHTLYKKAQIAQNKFFLEMLPKDIAVTIYVLRMHIQAGNYQISETEKRMLHTYDQYTLKGFVDRIDTVDDFIKVIDYKSSNKELDLSLAMQGFNIQMLLYMDMLVKQTGNKPGATLYFNTKKRVLKSKNILEPEDFDSFLDEYKMQGYTHPDSIEEIDNSGGKSSIIDVNYVKSRAEYSGKIMDEENFSKLMEYIHYHIEVIYEKMTEGNIEIKPKRSYNTTTDSLVNPCGYCNYRSLCRYDLFYNDDQMVTKEKVDAQMIGGADNEA